MKVKDKVKIITGKLSLTAYDDSGAEIWSDTGRNLIVSSGYTALAECLTGNVEAQISHIEIGTRKDTPIDTDTGITNPVKIGIEKTEYTDTGLCFGFKIALDEASGMSICEFGIITKDGRLFARRVRLPFEKTDYMSIVGEWSINFI